MATTDRARHRAARRTRELLQLTGVELREARVSLGLSQAHVALAAAMSHAQVSRIERGVHGHVALFDLAAIASVVGLDLSVRVYPGGVPIRDAAHVALLERLRRRLGPGLVWRAEVPLGVPGDRRAWDATINDRDGTIALDAETRLRDLQALVRRIALKQQDAHVARVLLLVRESRANREALRLGGVELDARFPMRSRDVLAVLGSGRLPSASGIVVL